MLEILLGAKLFFPLTVTVPPGPPGRRCPALTRGTLSPPLTRPCPRAANFHPCPLPGTKHPSLLSLPSSISPRAQRPRSSPRTYLSSAPLSCCFQTSHPSFFHSKQISPSAIHSKYSFLLRIPALLSSLPQTALSPSQRTARGGPKAVTRARRCGARPHGEQRAGPCGGAVPCRAAIGPAAGRGRGGCGSSTDTWTPALGPRPPAAPGRSSGTRQPAGPGCARRPVRPLGSSARRERGSDGGSAEPEGNPEPRGSLRFVPAGRCPGLSRSAVRGRGWRWLSSERSWRCGGPAAVCPSAASCPAVCLRLTQISALPCLVLCSVLPGARDRSPFLCRSRYG